MKGLWKRFNRITSQCYDHFIGASKDGSVWDQAYAVLIEIIHDGRSRDSNYASELYLLDEGTDYQYDVGGWLEDYLDYLDASQQYERLCQVCTELIGLFQWEEEKPTDLRFYIATSLEADDKKEESLAFCEDWYKKEGDNVAAATALIHARTAVGDFKGAEQIIDTYISEDGECTDDNDMVYTAAELLYKVSGNKEAEKRVREAINRYDEELEAYYSVMGGEGIDFNMDDIDEEDLPFN